MRSSIYAITVTTLTRAAPTVDVYEVAAVSALAALEHLKDRGWVMWNDIDGFTVQRTCTARCVPQKDRP